MGSWIANLNFQQKVNIIFGSYTVFCSICLFRSASNTNLHLRRLLWEETDLLNVSPALLRLLSDEEWKLEYWQLALLLSLVISSHLLCRVSRCGHWQAILGRNFSVPLSNQTNTTLKVNTSAERKMDKIRAADPLFLCGLKWQCMWCKHTDVRLNLYLTFLPLRYKDYYYPENTQCTKPKKHKQLKNDYAIRRLGKFYPLFIK